MADDLFGNQRFKPAPTKAATEDDSGKEYRTQTIGKTIQVGEAELLAEVDRIPALPAVVQKILTLAGSMSSTAQDMEDLIRQDMVIAGRLLKLVNSPFYGLSKSVSSIAQAVSIVGFSSLKSLVMAASTANLMVLDLSCYGFKTDGLWKNSIVTAALARDIAKRCGVDKDEAEEFFLAGLMRDVGMLVLGPIMAKNNVALRKQTGTKDDILTRERRAVGFDHCWAGERVADKWRQAVADGEPARLRQHGRLDPRAVGDLHPGDHAGADERQPHQHRAQLPAAFEPRGQADDQVAVALPQVLAVHLVPAVVALHLQRDSARDRLVMAQALQHQRHARRIGAQRHRAAGGRAQVGQGPDLPRHRVVGRARKTVEAHRRTRAVHRLGAPEGQAGIGSGDRDHVSATGRAPTAPRPARWRAAPTRTAGRRGG